MTAVLERAPRPRIVRAPTAAYTYAYTHLRMWRRPWAAYGRPMIDGDAGTTAPGLTWSEETASQAVLHAIAEQAAGDPGRAALVDSAGGGELGYREFTELVPAAARGLVRRGIRPGDAGAVHVEAARDLAVGVHAVTAAGAVPVVLPPRAAPAELAGLLIESEARFLLTSGPLAHEALAATERSYVRQVFSFGDVPGATSFGELCLPDGEWEWPAVDPLRDLALWTPAEQLTHADRLADLYRLSGAVEVTEGDVVVACAADFRDRAATWLGLIDLALTHGATFVGVPGGGPALAAAVERYAATIAVTTPANLRALAFDHPVSAVPELRLLVTDQAPAEVAGACRRRHGWTVSTFL